MHDFVQDILTRRDEKACHPSTRHSQSTAVFLGGSPLIRHLPVIQSGFVCSKEKSRQFFWDAAIARRITLWRWAWRQVDLQLRHRSRSCGLCPRVELSMRPICRWGAVRAFAAPGMRESQLNRNYFYEQNDRNDNCCARPEPRL